MSVQRSQVWLIWIRRMGLEQYKQYKYKWVSSYHNSLGPTPLWKHDPGALSDDPTGVNVYFIPIIRHNILEKITKSLSHSACERTEERGSGISSNIPPCMFSGSDYTNHFFYYKFYYEECSLQLINGWGKKNQKGFSENHSNWPQGSSIIRCKFKTPLKKNFNRRMTWSIFYLRTITTSLVKGYIERKPVRRQL